jgi:rod shape-determining protein MreB and related proteins
VDLSRYRRSFRGGDIAVDLGTANTVVFVRGQGVTLFEPSVIAIDDISGEVLAVGDEAKRMIGRTPASIHATRPLRHGVITDFETTEQMLRHFIRKAISKNHLRPRVILCVPSGTTEVERRAVEEATVVAGGREAHLIEEAMAAAIGADLPVSEPGGCMVVDIGGGTTEVAVISLGGMVVSDSLRLGGYEMDEAIANHLKTKHKLAIGEEQAERTKIEIGSALDLGDARDVEVAGRDLLTGFLRRVVVTSDEVRGALAGTVARIVECVKGALERTPPELSADVMDRGVALVGGGSLLRGFDRHLRDETGLPVHLVQSPLTCVATGAGRSLEEFEAIKRSAARQKARGRGRTSKVRFGSS